MPPSRPRVRRLAVLAAAATGATLPAGPAHADTLNVSVTQAAGSRAGAIQSAVDSFRGDLSD